MVGQSMPEALPGGKTLALFLALSLCGKLGDMIAPWALAGGLHPLWLLSLNASDALCLLTAGSTTDGPREYAAWLTVATLRRVIEDVSHFTIGARHGKSAAAFLLQQHAAKIRQISASRGSRALSLISLGIFPSLPACVAAGCSGMPTFAFLLVDFTLTVLRLLVIRETAASPSLPLGAVLDAVARMCASHRLKAVAASSLIGLPGIWLTIKRFPQTADGTVSIPFDANGASAHGRSTRTHAT